MLIAGIKVSNKMNDQLIIFTSTTVMILSPSGTIFLMPLYQVTSASGASVVISISTVSFSTQLTGLSLEVKVWGYGSTWR